MVGREACWRLYTGIEHRKSQDRPSHHVICCMVPVVQLRLSSTSTSSSTFFRRQAPESNIIPRTTGIFHFLTSRLTHTRQKVLKMVRTIALNDGKKIPSLGWGNMHGDDAVEKCATALKLGIMHIDTAQVGLLSLLQVEKG